MFTAIINGVKFEFSTESLMTFCLTCLSYEDNDCNYVLQDSCGDEKYRLNNQLTNLARKSNGVYIVQIDNALQMWSRGKMFTEAEYIPCKIEMQGRYANRVPDNEKKQVLSISDFLEIERTEVFWINGKRVSTRTTFNAEKEALRQAKIENAGGYGDYRRYTNKRD